MFNPGDVLRVPFAQPAITGKTSNMVIYPLNRLKMRDITNFMLILMNFMLVCWHRYCMAVLWSVVLLSPLNFKFKLTELNILSFFQLCASVTRDLILYVKLVLASLPVTISPVEDITVSFLIARLNIWHLISATLYISFVPSALSLFCVGLYIISRWESLYQNFFFGSAV